MNKTIVRIEVVAGGLKRELPVNVDGFRGAISEKGKDLSGELREGREASIKTKARENRKLNLDHVK